MADQKVNIDIRTKGAKKAKDDIKGLNGSIAKMGKAVGIASAAYFGAKGLINSFGTIIELAGQQELAEKKLETALGRTSKALLDQASSLQKVTTFGDEATIEQQALLASLGFTEDKIMDIIPVAMDLASATGMELESAVRNTAKTFSGLAGELGELVPQLRDLTAEEMKAGDAVKVMADLFGGQAQENTKTMSGSIDQMKNSFGDAGEAIGQLFAPTVISVTKVLRLTAESISRIAKSIGSDLPEAVIKASEEFARQSETIKGTQEQYLNAKDTLNLLNESYEVGSKGQKAFESALKSIALASGDSAKQLAILTTATENDIIKQKDFTESLNQVRKSKDGVILTNIKLVNQSEILKTDMRDQIQLAGALSSALNTAFDPKLGGGQALKGFILSLISSMQGVVLASKAMSKALTFAFVPGVGVGAAVASLIALEGAKAVVRNQTFEFADGGIVPGNPSTGDSVPAMLTPGEVILNASQQQGLLNNMSGVTVNIQGNMIGNEEFVRDTLIPEIDRTVNRGLA